MDIRLHRLILSRRIELLKAHLRLREEPEYAAPAPGFERELAKVEAELQAIGGSDR